MDLNQGWKLYYFEKVNSDDTELSRLGYDDDQWYDAAVPGDVHSTLAMCQAIDDPYYSTNDVKCQWIDRKFWWYRNTFHFADLPQPGERLELTFEGLDTYVSIFLNGENIGSHDNMFMPKTIDVTEKIVKGSNILALKFLPVGEVIGHKSTKDMWTFFNGQRPWIRKCAMTFGWDWGPRLVTVGLWRNVRLEKKKFAKIDYVFLKSKDIDVKNNFARVEFAIGVENFANVKDMTLEVSLANDEAITAAIPVTGNITHACMELTNARLWWPHDLGEPNLYQARVNLKYKDETIDFFATQYGVRDIQVKLFDEVYKTRFTFFINGTPIFARGANWIPAHNFIGAIKESTYTQLLRMTREANMNMLRVWGGGIYEHEAFYRECDRLGILVWQDFMFACAEYPDFDDEFMKSVEQEVIWAVKHLRNHPSIALWVGNNENQQLHAAILGPKPFRELYGRKIYEELMPRLLKELDDTRMYWPGSAYGGDDPQNQEIGDRHNWDVWHGEVPSYKKYAEDSSRFCSEFGLHAAPVKYTLERNIPAKKLYLSSFELDYRNKDLNPDKVKILMNNHTGLPRDIDEYIDFSMLLQAEGLKYAVEHYRRRFPETSGALIWQLNDCWPGQSWSMIDYYLYPKASYHYAKRFFAPVLLSFKEEENETLSLWVTNNSMTDYRDIIHTGINNFLGQEFYGESIPVDIAAHTSKKIKTLKVGGGFGSDVVVFQKRWLYAYLKPDHSGIPGNEYFFKEYKDCKLPDCRLEIRYEPIEKGLKVTLSSEVFARFVKIEHRVDGTEISDNYFNICPGDTKTVTVTHSTQQLTPEMFTVRAINSEEPEGMGE